MLAGDGQRQDLLREDVVVVTDLRPSPTPRGCRLPASCGPRSR